MDFIKRVVSYKQEGHTLKQLQEAFDIPSQTYYSHLTQELATEK